MRTGARASPNVPMTSTCVLAAGVCVQMEVDVKQSRVARWHDPLTNVCVTGNGT